MLAEPGTIFPQLQTGAVTTSDATATLVWSYAIPTNSAGRVLVHIVGRKSDGSQRAAYTKLASYYRASSAGAQGGSTETIGTDYESDSAWDVSIDVSSSVLRVLVTGAAATTVYWTATITHTAI